jgi:thiamine pyrophosphate-dependent acetolactate synthase large subunit-like protein
MNLGSLATIAGAGATNLVVIVFDNGVYQVTGSQPVPGATQRDFAAIARGCGIASVFRCGSIDEWRTAAPQVLDARGPTVVVLDTRPSDAPAPRSPGPAGDRARALMRALASPS